MSGRARPVSHVEAPGAVIRRELPVFACRAEIARLRGIIELAAGLQGRRRDVIGAAPDMDLLVAMLGRGLGLVEPGQAAIVALIEPPVLLDRNPQQPHVLQNRQAGLDRALFRV